MKQFYTIIFILLLSSKTFSANITIIQSPNSTYTADTVWRHVASSMGHNAIIVPDTALDNTFFIGYTDVLITPVWDITYTSARQNNIISYLQSGKTMNPQVESDMSFDANQL